MPAVVYQASKSGKQLMPDYFQNWGMHSRDFIFSDLVRRVRVHLIGPGSSGDDGESYGTAESGF